MYPNLTKKSVEGELKTLDARATEKGNGKSASEMFATSFNSLNKPYFDAGLTWLGLYKAVYKAKFVDNPRMERIDSSWSDTVVHGQWSWV